MRQQHATGHDVRSGRAFATTVLAATAGASIQQLPPGAQVNDDPPPGSTRARTRRLRRRRRLARRRRRPVPWAAFEQQTARRAADLRARLQGRRVEDAGPVAEHRPATRRPRRRRSTSPAPAAPCRGWRGTSPTASRRQDEHLRQPLRRGAEHVDPRGPGPRARQQGPVAEHPHQPGGREPRRSPAARPRRATTRCRGSPGRRRTAATPTTRRPDLRLARRSSRPTARQPAGRRHGVNGFCWQQVGIGRLKAARSSLGGDPTLNIDPTRNGIEPDIAFTGPTTRCRGSSGTRRRRASASACATTSMVFAAKAVNDAAPWQASTGSPWATAPRPATLDNSRHQPASAAAPRTRPPRATLLAQREPGQGRGGPARRGRHADAGRHHHAVGRLGRGARRRPQGHLRVAPRRRHHFELANSGQPVSNTDIDAEDPDITFSGNTPYVTWHSNDKTVVGHFAGLTTFKVDTVTPEQADGRSPVSSSNTSDPFTADGQTPPAGTVGTPFFLDADRRGAAQAAGARLPARTRCGPYAASDVKPTTAHVNGSVDPAGAPVKVHFEFGPRPRPTASRDRRSAARAGQRPDRVLGPDQRAAPAPRIHYRSVR